MVGLVNLGGSKSTHVPSEGFLGGTCIDMCLAIRIRYCTSATQCVTVLYAVLGYESNAPLGFDLRVPAEPANPESR